VTTLVFCENCGSTVKASARFCGTCGSQQPSAPGDEPAVRSEPVHPPTGPSGAAVGQELEPSAASNGPSSAVAPTSPQPKTAGPKDKLAGQYRVCVVRECAAGPVPAEESLLFPVALDERDTIALEPRDGSDIRHANCTAIKVAQVGATNSLLRVKDIRGRVLLTDARITVACSRFDKGGGWWGMGAGALVAIPLNVGSHALAAHRRRGRMLVGQVRYPWITEVYAQSKVGYKGVESLRVVANVGGKSRLRLDLQFPKDVDALAIGTELVHRVARFRLKHDEGEMDEAERERLVELTTVPKIVYVKETGNMGGHKFPTSWPASERSARFGLVSGEVAS
jgi:hypothetical protein